MLVLFSKSSDTVPYFQLFVSSDLKLSLSLPQEHYLSRTDFN